MVLSRFKDQSVILTIPDGRRIRVTVVDIRNGEKVRIGVDAPQDVTVHRDEIQLKVDREGQRRQRP